MNVYSGIKEFIEEENKEKRIKEKCNKEACSSKKEACSSKKEACASTNRKIKAEKCNEFVENLTNYLLVEAFQRVFDKAMKDNIFDREDNDIQGLSKSLLVNYVEEQTGDKILRRMMSRGGIVLTELAKVIKETVDEAKEEIDPNDENTLAVNRYELDNFFDTLDMTDFSNITNLIHFHSN